MSKRFFAAAFAAGFLVVAWVALGFVGTQALALAMTVAIAAVYLLGAWELRQFRAGTAGLASALADLAQPPAALQAWLERVPDALRPAVRGRIEGLPRALPGPALTPYLVGLLVMLGMLGTFLGMVVTFKGAVFALEGSADLQAMRGALAEPIKGLGLSFGTSVAGVAASAMLGLMSAIARRERLDVARQLDACAAGVLRPFSSAFQREASLQALQTQAGALPQVASQLEALMARMEARSQQLDEQLLQRQERFQRETQQAYASLAASVGRSLEQSLAAGAQAAGQSITPVVTGAMAQVVAESQRLHARLGEVAQAQLDGLSQRFADTAQTVAQGWTVALDDHRRSSDAVAQQLQQALAGFSQTFEARSAQLLTQVQAQLGHTADQMASHANAQALLWRTELEALRDTEAQRGQAAVDRLGALEAAVAQHLAALGASLEAPLSRLLQTAAEVPQAAASVITQLREEMSRMAERDNASLEDRTALLAQLAGLVQSVQQATGEQRQAIEALVHSAGAVMQEAGQRFAELLQAQAGQAQDATAQVGASAVEMASAGEAFGQGVQQFQASSDQLIDGLQRIEAALARATSRSDEQLAYYVAQAREVIDLSISAQHGILDRLQQQLKSSPVQVLTAGELA